MANKNDYTPVTDVLKQAIQSSQTSGNPYMQYVVPVDKLLPKPPSPRQELFPSLNIKPIARESVDFSAFGAKPAKGENGFISALSALGSLGAANTNKLYTATNPEQWKGGIGSKAEAIASGAIATAPLTGAAIGAAIGSFVPGIGTAIGATAGFGYGLLASKIGAFIPTSRSDIKMWGKAFDSQSEAWKNGVFEFRDLPGVGVLSGLSQNAKSGKDILTENFGAKDGPVKLQDMLQGDSVWNFWKHPFWKAIDAVDIGGFAVDVLADPTTYMASRASNAILQAEKTGLKASNDVITRLAGEGIEVIGQVSKKQTAKSTAEVVRNSVETSLKDQLAKNANFNTFGEYSTTIEDLAEKFRQGQITDPNVKAQIDEFYTKLDGIKKESSIQAQTAFNFVDNAMRETRASFQNALSAWKIPFTKIGGSSKTQVPNFMRKVDKEIGATGETAVRNVFNILGIKNLDDMNAIIKAQYGVDDIKKMTIQAKDHFIENISRFNRIIADEVITSLQKTNITQSQLDAISEVIFSERATSSLGGNITEKLRNIKPDGIRFTDAQNQRLVQSQVNSIGSEVDPVALTNAMNEGLDPTNFNIYKAHNQGIEFIKKQLEAEGKTADEIQARIGQFKTNFKTLVATVNAEKMKELEPFFDNIKNIIEDKVNAFKGATLATSDDIELLKSQMEKAKETFEQIKDKLNKEADAIKDAESKINTNATGFELVTDFSIQAEDLFKKYIDIPNPDYKSYNNEVKDLIQQQFGFRSVALESEVQKNVNEELLFKNVKGTVAQLDLLSRAGFNIPNAYSDLTVYIKQADRNYKGKTMASYDPNPTAIRITIEPTGEASFIHEFMHYLDHKISDKYPGSNGVGHAKNEAAYRKNHPLYKFAIYGRDKNINSGLHSYTGSSKVYGKSHTEIVARMFSQSMVAKLKKELVIPNNKNPLILTESLKDFATKSGFKKGFDSVDSYSDDFLNKVYDEFLDILKSEGLRGDPVANVKAQLEALKKQKKNVVAKLKRAEKNYNAVTKDMQNKLTNLEIRNNQFQREFFTANKFTPDMIVKRLTGSKYINPHSLSSKNSFVEAFGKPISQADTIMYGEKVRMQKDLRYIEGVTKKFTQDELYTIPYLLENTFPKGMSKEEFFLSKGITNPDAIQRIEDVAQRMKDIFDKLAILEQEVGSLVRLRQDYFPHVYVKSNEETLAMLEELAKKFPEDESLKQLTGRNQKLGFDRNRKSFQTIAEIDDYITKIDEEIATLNANGGNLEKITQLQYKKQRLYEMYERNPITALVKRYNKSIRSRVMKELYNQFEQNSLIVKDKSGRDFNINDMHQLNKEEARFLGLEENTFINKEIFEGLKKIDGIFKDTGVNKVLKEIDSVVSIWKQALTAVVPKYYVYNFIGNIFNNILAGISISSYKEANTIMQKIRSKTLTQQDKAFLNQAIRDGVVNQGFLSDMSKYFKDSEMYEEPTIGQKIQRSIGQKVENVPVLGRGSKFSYMGGLGKVGEWSDDFTRLAHYLDVLNKTGSRTIATDSVRKYLFNYREMSVGDRYMRTLIPFWSWTRNNLPLQFEKLVTEPKYALTWFKIKQQTQGELDDADVPDWIKESSFFIGNQAIDLRLPLTDLAQVFQNTPAATMREFLGMTNPLIKNVFEIAMNKKLFNQRPIYYGKTPVQDWTAYALQQFGQFGSTTANLAFKDEPDVAKEIAKLFGPIPRDISGK